MKGYHFEEKKGKVRVNPKEYYWHIPKGLRSEELRNGDVLLVETEDETAEIIVGEVVVEAEEESEAKYKRVIEKTGARIEIDIAEIKARRARNRESMERKRIAKAARKEANRAAMAEAQAAKAARLAEQSANKQQPKGGVKEAAASPSKASTAVGVKASPFERIKAHLQTKAGEYPPDSARGRSRRKAYEDYMNWLTPREQAIAEGTLKYAEAAEEIAKLTGIRIGRKADT